MNNTAVAEARDEIYDELSLNERDTYDSIAAAGFTPEMDGSRWTAVSNLTGHRVGPCPTILELAVTIVATEDTENSGLKMEFVDDDPIGINDPLPVDDSTSDEDEDQEPDDGVSVEIDADHRGNVYLPGVKPVVDQQLADAAGKYFADNRDWSDAGKRRKDSKSALDTVAAMKRHLFTQDPDNTNSLIYHAGGLKIRMAKESKTTVTVEEDSDE